MPVFVGSFLFFSPLPLWAWHLACWITWFFSSMGIELWTSGHPGSQPWSPTQAGHMLLHWPPHSQHASATGHFWLDFFFFSPLPQVETHSAPAYADTWLTVKCGVNLSTQACCLDTATVIKVTCDSDIIIRKKWGEGGKWTGVSSIFGYSHSIFSYT